MEFLSVAAMKTRKTGALLPSLKLCQGINLPGFEIQAKQLDLHRLGKLIPGLVQRFFPSIKDFGTSF
jgi:hypothetical protein